MTDQQEQENRMTWDRASRLVMGRYREFIGRLLREMTNPPGLVEMREQLRQICRDENLALQGLNDLFKQARREAAEASGDVPKSASQPERDRFMQPLQQLPQEPDQNVWDQPI